MGKVYRVIVPLFCVFAWAGGCATRPGTIAQPSTAPSAELPAANEVLEKAGLQLDEIQPRPQLSTTRPASQPAARAPIEAINLYAQAVNALQTGRRFTAINTLEKAIALDPHSFELNYALGQAHVTSRTQDEKSIAAFERAAAIRPDHLALQINLGRQYLARNEVPKAIEHLRLAVQTTQYAADEAGAGAADLFLGRALQQAGYDRAALEQYAKLLRRVQGRTISFRSDPQLAFLITDRLYVDIGDLYARNGQLEDALAAFEPAALRDPSDFSLEARVVRAMAGLRRFDDASRRASEVVVRFRASKESLDLLNEVSKASGVEGGAASALLRLAAERPQDTTLLFALVELLKGEGRWAQAEGLLAAYVERTPGDFSAIRRRVLLRLERNDAEGAGGLIVQTLAAQPDLADEIGGLLPSVTSLARPDRLRIGDLQAMEVLPFELAAKELSVAIVAEELNRNALAAQALERAVKVAPPFPPAFRKRVMGIWRQRGVSQDDRVRMTDELVAAASTDPSLAEELRGLSLLYRKQGKPAAEALGKAMERGGKSPALLQSYAMALRAAGETSKFEQLMWKLLSDNASYADAYSTLYGHYSEAGSEAQADRVLNTWLTADPSRAPARLLQAARLLRTGRTESALQSVNKLVEEMSDDSDVVGTAYAFYARTGKVDEFRTLLEQELREQPGNVAAVAVLAELAEEKGEPARALAAVDAARTALASDPDALYQVAHLYTRVGKKQTTEEVLQQVLAIDPAHPPASNDLGYGWAERGENLARAEALIRQAVAAEPENLSFLDSLGWVLYKRGKFSEALPSLQKAAADVSQADAVVLDHLGDVLYRLGDRAGAGKQWGDAAAKVGTTPPAGRDDLAALKKELDRKTEQLNSGQPVTVSPVTESATAEVQTLTK